MPPKSVEELIEERVESLAVETGSIGHFDDPAVLLAASPHLEFISSSKQTRVHDPLSSISQEPGIVISQFDNTKPLHLPKKTTDVISDTQMTSSLPQEEDSSDDELDLLKKTPPSLVEPSHRPTTPGQQPGAFKTMVEKDSHVPSATSQTERRPELAVPILGSVSLQPVVRSVFRNSLATSEDAHEQSEEAFPRRATVSASAAHKSTDSAITHDILLPETPTPTRKTIVLVTSQPSVNQGPDYTFPEVSTPQPAPLTSKDPPQRLHQFQSNFTLPPLKSLNSDHKKSKSMKRRREAAGVKEGRKDDWAPMGLNKWAATVNANPVWKKVARASKCLTTREWVIAMTELRLIRAIDRIELLKREGRWSFRQPKKQRAIGGVLKTHWDYLMDEMRWMRVDFREERKWKLALAYNISNDVLDWHAAGTAEARVAKGICVRWKRGPTEPQTELAINDDTNVDHSDDHAEMEVDTEETQPDEGMSLLGIDYGSEDEYEDNDEEPDQEPQNVVDALEPSTLIASVLENENVDTENKSRTSLVEGLQLKTEEVEDLSALIKPDPASDVGSNMILDDIKPDTSFGLKLTSNDPVLASQPTPSSNGGDVDSSSGTLKTGKSNKYARLREAIAYSDNHKIFLDLEDFNVAKLNAPLKTSDETMPPPPGLESIFPDLHVLDFDWTPVVQTADGRKRTERKIERDDPYKRPDDILYTRLYPTGHFMTSKPTLIGPLRPSKNWKEGQWLPLDDSAIMPESDTTAKIDDSCSDLFDCRSSSGPSLIALQLQTALMKDKELRKRNDHLWSNAEDTLLKSLCDRYPNNWALISECFNASRLTVPTDKRTPRDCLDRWREKWGPENRRALETPPTVEATPPPTSTQMTTRGVKRLASASISSVSPSGMPAGSEPRKKRRHALVLETIRKAGKKRTETLQKAQSQRKTSSVHETHAQYSKLPKRTPAELSRVKAEKEALALQELQVRKKQEELARNNVLNRITNGQGPPIPQAQTPQSQLQPQNASGMQRPPGTSMPAQVVPQIRNQVNISQQQRTSTPSMQAGRFTQQQQLLQAQARAAQQQQQQVLAHAQSQIQTNGVAAVNGNVSGTNPHLSPPSYMNRDVALSVSPPHNSAATSAVNSPRPPSAQAQTQVPGNTGSRGTYYLPNISSVQGYTTEQLQTALRLTQSVLPAMSSHVQGNVNYDPLPLTSDDHPSNHLYNAPPSPSSASFHTPQYNPTELGVDSASFPLGAAQPRFLGAALYDDTGAPHIRNSYASTHNTNHSEDTGSVYALNDTLGATPLRHGSYGGYRDDPTESFGNLPMSPMGPSQGRFMEEKRAVYAPPRAKSKRNIIILAVLAALLLIILAIVIPVYFAVIKPNSNKISNPDTSDPAAKPSSTTATSGTPKVAAVVTGGDGSKVTLEDGTTFTYRNPFGGYWYWDENDPFNNGAKAQSWSPALNETFQYGTDKIRG
ncbi:hypothetical protein C0992_008782 [Termitomyces sp. T32_za158]|nr:hypothetical protein C0992_008782 [Termitomyces sp. T32_za158]